MSTLAIASAPLPSDIQTFIDQREGCDHFRGEPWDSGNDPEVKERREFIFQNLKKLCTGTDKRLADLRQKYRDNPVVSDYLNNYEAHIELKPEPIQR